MSNQKDRAHETLRYLSCQKAKQLYGDPLPLDVAERLNLELETIKHHEASGYFLFLREVVHVAQTELGVYIGPGRGTSAGSLVNYCLSITKVDPLEFGLLFERFFSPESAGRPDIYLDCDCEGRELLVDWLKQSSATEPYIDSGGLFGLEALSVIRDTTEIIKRDKGIGLEMQRIPLDDFNTLALFRRGETEGIFLFDTEDMLKFLLELRPGRFEDLALLYSLYQAGLTEDIREVSRRKNGKKTSVCPIPGLRKYLQDTYGVIVYQEQIMCLSRLIANFTEAESDQLRRAAGKKQIALLPALKDRFSAGGLENGISADDLEEVWAEIEHRGMYAFIKAHAVSYTLIAYQMAYLKAYYPVEFDQVAHKYPSY